MRIELELQSAPRDSMCLYTHEQRKPRAKQSRSGPIHEDAEIGTVLFVAIEYRTLGLHLEVDVQHEVASGSHKGSPSTGWRSYEEPPGKAYTCLRF